MLPQSLSLTWTHQELLKFWNWIKNTKSYDICHLMCFSYKFQGEMLSLRISTWFTFENWKSLSYLFWAHCVWRHLNIWLVQILYIKSSTNHAVPFLFIESCCSQYFYYNSRWLWFSSKHQKISIVSIFLVFIDLFSIVFFWPLFDHRKSSRSFIWNVRVKSHYHEMR